MELIVNDIVPCISKFVKGAHLMLNVLTTNKTKPKQRDKKETWGGVESNDGITGICVWPTHQVSFQRNLQNMTYVLFLVYINYTSVKMFCMFPFLKHFSVVSILSTWSMTPKFISPL